MAVVDPLSQECLSNLFRTSQKDHSRIISREGSTLEFKQSFNSGNMSQYFKTMAAFANNSGGYLLFGIGDKPRKLIGLDERHLTKFEELKAEDLTRGLLDYFSPEIRWDHCTFEFRGNSYGVIYVFPLKRKPCICKKNYNDSNSKYSLKEGDIYYRYGARSERIHYPELSAIIEQERKEEEKQWLRFAKKAVRIGVTNAALLDLNTGNLAGTGGSIVLDEDLLKKISFIKEGSFVETGGSPTLRIIGDVTDISTGKVVVGKATRKIVRAIEPHEIIKAFLEDQKVDNPMEYVKRVCSASSAYYPVYYYLRQAKANPADALKVINGTIARGSVKEKLIKRLSGTTIDKNTPPSQKTEVAQKKTTYYKQWLTECIPEAGIETGYCIEALLYLSDEEIRTHSKYIRNTLSLIYSKEYEKMTSILASNMRKIICRIDEALFRQA